MAIHESHDIRVQNGRAICLKCLGCECCDHPEVLRGECNG